MRAYIMVKVKPQHTAQLMQDFKSIDDVKEACLIHGVYDCVLTVKGKDISRINDVVAAVRELKGVVDTTTSIIIHSWKRDKKGK